MADKNVIKNRMAKRRRRRVRGKVSGNGQRPRLSVCKSLKNVFVQLIDDEKHVTLMGVASNSPIIKETAEALEKKTAVARKVGLKIAEMAKAKGIETAVFDRNCYRYHGRIRAVAEGAREGGLKF